MTDHEPLLVKIVRPILFFILKWFYGGLVGECSICEQPYAECTCEVDQPGDNIEIASLRQEIRWLRGLLQP